jgi:hypothetical protein
MDEVLIERFESMKYNFEGGISLIFTCCWLYAGGHNE